MISFQAQFTLCFKQRIIILMRNQETFFATSQTDYYQTSRSKDDPIIVHSKNRNVQLPYRVCNQIFKGKSIFTNPQAEQYYNEYMKAKQQYDIEKSQKTDDCSQLGQTHKNYQKKQRNLSNFHVLTPSNKQNVSHLSNQQRKYNTTGRSKQKQNRLALSFSHPSTNNSQTLSNDFYQTEAEYEKIQSVESQNEDQAHVVEKDPFAQIQKLKRLLLSKENQLTEKRKELRAFKNKQNQSYKNGQQLKQQLGGTVPALMYITLFMVLLTKNMTAQ